MKIMTPLAGKDILELHAIALRDKRLDRAARIILTGTARTGTVGHLKTQMQHSGLNSIDAVKDRIGKLVAYGYLPVQAAVR